MTGPEKRGVCMWNVESKFANLLSLHPSSAAGAFLRLTPNDRCL
jgi:hypothetical protein